jgi:integrase
MLLKRKFRPLLRALGIHVPRGNGFHAFRHANSTLMSSFGASLKLRQQRLGHADGSLVTETSPIDSVTLTAMRLSKSAQKGPKSR